METPKRDLRSSGPLWLKDRQAKLRILRAPRQAEYDVAIIGAGVSGALAAASLADSGLSIVMFDRRGPASGSTAASTAMIQWEIDKTLLALSGKIGRKKAAAVYRSSLAGLISLRRLVLTHHVDCDWADRTALTVTGDSIGRRALHDEWKLRSACGFPSYWMEGKDLRAAYGMDRTAALVSGMNAELHPVKLTIGLLRAAIAKGLEVVAPADVTEISASSRGVSLRLATGSELRAGKLIVCSGYEALPAIPKQLYRLISTWALATRPTDAAAILPARPIVWEQSDPYLYLRTTPDNRIVAGGEDEDFTTPAKRDALVGRKSAVIMKKLTALIPEFKGQVDYAWAGTFAESPTGLPAIGPVPGMKNVFATLGAGGNGITFSAIAANIAREWVQGRRHPDQALFGFG